MLLKEKNHDAACKLEKEKQESLCAPREGENLICPVRNLACSLKQPFLEHLHLAQWRAELNTEVLRYLSGDELAIRTLVSFFL